MSNRNTSSNITIELFAKAIRAKISTIQAVNRQDDLNLFIKQAYELIDRLILRIGEDKQEWYRRLNGHVGAADVEALLSEDGSS